MDSSFSSDSNEFLSIFKEIDNIELDSNWEKSLKVFMLQIDSKDFDYESLKDKLLEPLLWFVLSRQKIKEYIWKPMWGSKQVRWKLRDYLSNTWELWEYLLYCFLESDLGAPKILSKLELKTSPNDYVKWADWVHIKKIWDDYVLLFWESKTIIQLKKWIDSALLSIYDFKNWIKRNKEWVETDRDTSKFWIWYEKALISDNLWKETFNEDEEKFFKSLIFPSRNNNCNVNTGFAIFIWFEIDISKFQDLSNAEFSNKLEEVLKEKINKKKDYILEEIKTKNLQWHNLYFYFLPFSRLNETREEITKHIIT